MAIKSSSNFEALDNNKDKKISTNYFQQNNYKFLILYINT